MNPHRNERASIRDRKSHFDPFHRDTQGDCTLAGVGRRRWQVNGVSLFGGGPGGFGARKRVRAELRGAVRGVSAARGPGSRDGFGARPGVPREYSVGREDGFEGVFAAHHVVAVGLGQVPEAAVEDHGEDDVVERGVVGRSAIGDSFVRGTLSVETWKSSQRVTRQARIASTRRRWDGK